MKPDTDHLDTRPSSMLVNSTPTTALRGRATLTLSEMEDEWRRWAQTEKARAAVENAIAATRKLLAVVRGSGVIERDWTGFLFDFNGYRCQVTGLMAEGVSDKWWRISADGISQAKPLSSDELATIESLQAGE